MPVCKHIELAPSSELGERVTIVQGSIVVACVVAFRRGMIGEPGHWLKKPL